QDVMRFGYHDYRQHMQSVSSNFTPSGWESFTKAMKEARIFEAVDARKLVVTLEIQAAPEIKSSFVREGTYTWYLQFPILIKFEGNEAPAAIRAMLIMQVVRVSTLQSADGISIEQWVAKLM
ncbi:MAG: DotI/IcmL family type IV secretion protein, partial [Alphaproteobacteria bacterium]|nr:DotI/IcmL family type IV secretion protein [Alphaproteobacteria bacterium]